MDLMGFGSHETGGNETGGWQKEGGRRKSWAARFIGMRSTAPSAWLAFSENPFLDSQKRDGRLLFLNESREKGKGGFLPSRKKEPPGFPGGSSFLKKFPAQADRLLGKGLYASGTSLMVFRIRLAIW